MSPIEPYFSFEEDLKKEVKNYFQQMFVCLKSYIAVKLQTDNLLSSNLLNSFSLVATTTHILFLLLLFYFLTCY